MIEHLIPILAGMFGAAVPLIFAGLGELVTAAGLAVGLLIGA